MTEVVSLLEMLFSHSKNCKTKKCKGYCVTGCPLTLARIVGLCYEKKPALSLSRWLFEIGSETMLEPILMWVISKKWIRMFLSWKSCPIQELWENKVRIVYCTHNCIWTEILSFHRHWLALTSEEVINRTYVWYTELGESSIDSLILVVGISYIPPVYI